MAESVILPERRSLSTVAMGKHGIIQDQFAASDVRAAAGAGIDHVV